MANNPMLKFVTLAQSYPDKRPADLHAEDFREIADRNPPPKRPRAGRRAARNAACPIARSIARCITIYPIG